MTDKELNTIASVLASLDLEIKQTQSIIDSSVLHIKSLTTIRKTLATLLPKAVTPTAPKPVAAPTPTTVAANPEVPALAAFNLGNPANGATWFGASNGDGKLTGSGWPKSTDIQYMIDLGVKTIRLPIKPMYCLNADGTLNTWVVNELASRIKLAISKKVAVVLDSHTYRLFTDPSIGRFWSLFAPAIVKTIGGDSPYFGIELENEPGKGSKDLTLWTEPLRRTIKTIRDAGYNGYIFAGGGDWNNVTFLPQMIAEIVRTGGMAAMDPIGRTALTGHDYWNKDSDPSKTRNDQGAAVDGTIDFTKRYGPAIQAARAAKIPIFISEIGGGISPSGSLPPFNGIGKDGLQLQTEFFEFAKMNSDVLKGTWFWMGGKTNLDYRHKIEAGNQHTLHLQTFW